MNSSPDRRPDPEQLLKQVAFEESQRHSRLKVFLGYASGVGKTFRMLDEGRRRSERGEDVVIAALQDGLTPDLQSLIARQQVIPELPGPPRAIDLDAVLRRHPQVCLVDELAHANPPGAKHAQRWEDVEELLQAGISVLTAVNLQHIEELREVVQQITRKPAGDTVPKAFLMRAEEIAVVDVPPEQILERWGGQPEEQRLLAERRLSELREIALLLAAEIVDRQLETYLASHGVGHSIGAHEKILVCITPRASARAMIESGRRNAQRFHGEWMVAHVRQPALSPSDQQALEAHLAYAREAGAQVEVIAADDPVEAILELAAAQGASQIFIGHSLGGSKLSRLFPSPVDRLIRRAEGIDVRIFPH